MRTIQMQVYKFEELSEQAKDKALQYFRENQDWQFTNELIEENFSYLLEESLLPSENILFDLSYYKNRPYVTFKGDIDIIKLLKKHRSYTKFKKLFDSCYDVDVYLNNDKSPYIDVTVYAESSYEYFDDDVRQAVIDKLEEELEELRTELELFVMDIVKNMQEELVKRGTEELEFYESDEYHIENIKANEYEFTENGELF